MADTDSDNPLLKALPPETDYISYLTILEYNLTAEQLPTLHHILQDGTLTANIGWDLVHLLLPLLPASQQCLQDVSRLGNPREVVLKVTELLEGLASEDEEQGEAEGDDEEDESGGEKTAKKLEELTREDIKISVDGENEAQSPSNDRTLQRLPSKTLRFTALVEMLSILHPRIKTKFPSRFLSTSLQAVLPAYMQVARKPEATASILGFIKDLSGTQRPKLPPRKSSSAIPTQSAPQPAPDPEGQGEVIGADETKLQTRLLQSFLTYVTEAYMTSLVADEDVPGMAWSCRYQEKIHPEKIVPGRRSYTTLFSEEESLHERDAIMGHILALVRDLNMKVEEMLAVFTNGEDAEADEDDELPSTASDVPLSRTGSLYLLATMAASSSFFDAPASSLHIHLCLIPDYAAMLGNSLGDSATGSTGVEPEPLVDAVLFLGFLILKNLNSIITSKFDEVYHNILQRLSLLSANLPSPVLRYNAHLLTSSLLHRHPEDHFRLAFIRDTLEHCPFENLKASAVGWLKDELLAADKSTKDLEPKTDPRIFATPAALSTLESFLFPNASTLMEGQSTTDSYATFQSYQPFFLAMLNLLYLLLSSPSLSVRLDFTGRIKAQPSTFADTLQPLSDASRRCRSALLSGEILDDSDDEGKDAALAGLELVDMTVQQVESAISKIGNS